MNIIHVLKEQQPGDPDLKVLHISDSPFAMQSKARSLLEGSSMQFLGTPLAKKEDRLKEAARLMLKSGDVKAFCEIQLMLGNKHTALAYAPKVSLKYWQQIVQKTFLAEPDEEGFLLAGKVKEAAALLHQKGETRDAKMLLHLQRLPNPVETH